MGLRTGLLGMARAITDRGVSADMAESLARDPVDVVVVDCMLLEALRSAASRGPATASLVHTFQGWFTGPFARSPFGRAARLRGAPPVPTWAAADAELVLTLPELDRPSDAEQRSARGPSPRLGPAWHGPTRPTDFEPRVLVSLSTTWLPGQDKLMQRILDAVDGLPVEVIVTTGPALDPTSLRAPANVAIYRQLDHAELLPHVSLMIGHGGHGTAMRALAHDVPLLIIPGSSFADQVAVGSAVAESGAGRVLPRRSNVAAIRQAVQGLVGDGGHRAAAARLGARIRDHDGAVAAVDAWSGSPPMDSCAPTTRTAVGEFCPDRPNWQAAYRALAGGRGCCPTGGPLGGHDSGWFTCSVTDLPRAPKDPAALKAWVASLGGDDLLALTEQVASASDRFEEFDPRNRAIALPPPPAEPSMLTLTIELRDAEPRIWRRLSLPGNLTLDAVHTLFQAAMGWTDSHLHRFQAGDTRGYNEPYFVTEFDEEEGDEGTREDAVRLDQVLRAPGDRLTYLYDFGDGWEHRVRLESVAPLTADDREPRCLAGAGACPPEDVGGISGYQEVASWLRAGAPADEVPEPFDDAEHAHGWLPDGYDPDAFDVAEATAAMRLWAAGEHLPWHGLPEPMIDLVRGLRMEGWAQVDAWLNALSPRLPVELGEEDLARAARPWLAVLKAVGPGTKLTAAGYLPPAAVQQIAQDAGVTDRWIGKANREDLTWPVAVLRQAAQDVGLLRKAKGMLTPTARARAAAGDHRRLVAAVLQRLPLGRGVEAEAGWFALLGKAAGATGTDLDTGLALILTDRGWRTDGNSPISAMQARRCARPTLDLLESMAGGLMGGDPALLARLARATLFGVAAPA